MHDPVLLVPEGQEPPQDLTPVRIAPLEPLRRAVVHDLRNPLGIIIGNVELLREGVFGPLNERQSKALETIERQSERLTEGLEALADVLDGRR